MRVFRRSLRSAAVLLTLLGPGACAGDDLADFSVASTKPLTIRRSFPRTPGEAGFRRVVTLGKAEGLETETFGFVADAAFGPDGSIYVADAGQQRIVAYDSAGWFRRSFGRSGSGPGEFVSPSSLAVVSDTLFVYDDRQGRISVLDTAGKFYRSFPPPSTFMRHLRPGPLNTLLLTIAADSFIVTQTTLEGARIRQYVRRPRVEGGLGPTDVPEPGPICRRPDSFVYANPWRYELVSVALTPTGEGWARQYRNEVLRPVRPGRAGDRRQGAVLRGGGVLGLVCGEGYLLFAYLDLLTGVIAYDFIGQNGRPLARRQFARDQEEDYPGFLVDLRGSKLLAFRSRPFPQVSVWVVEPPRP